jgi:murein DD-endopeptidase MepM/ murein hydrolase activator NlpD
MKKLLAVPVGVVALVLILLIALSESPAIRFDPAPAAIGIETPVKVQVTSPHGLRSLKVFIEQNNQRYPIYGKDEPSTRLFWHRGVAPLEVTVLAGKKRVDALQDGAARVVVEAVANDFRASKAERAADVAVHTKPPQVTVDDGQHYIRQGGSELVTFTVSGDWNEAGVRVGKNTFRSWPLGGKANRRVCLFAFSWDTPENTVPLVYVRNAAGNEATARFWFKVFPKKYRKRDLNIDDRFLEKVVNQIDHGAPGDLLTRFLKINGELRRQNSQTLSDLRLKTADHFLWKGAFLQLGNSKVESHFADQRSYIYKGKKVDEQMHLGYDLSVTKNVPVQAENSGKVVWASELGIYGNCIVIDHGYGLQSIYGHLSSLDVKPGDGVKKGQTIGKSGATGLASGDHLHYSMQVDGVQVDPVEWWDAHWIHDRIMSKLPQ